MTLLEKICKDLGVEVGEEWIGNDGKFYSIDKDGKLVNYAYKEDGRKSYTDWIERVLIGDLKPKWEPKIGEEYFIPYFHEEKETGRYDWIRWDNTPMDRWLLKNNLAFKTKEEAIEATNKILTILKEEY